jgi:hypothetical protein
MFPVAIGVILWCGAFFRWRWLVDPPLSWSPYYSQALIKATFGTTAVIIFTYFLGALSIFCGLLNLHPTWLDGLGLKRIYPPP